MELAVLEQESIFDTHRAASAMHWSSVSTASDSAEGCRAEVRVPGSALKSMRRSAPPIANSWSNMSCGVTIAEIAPDQAASVQLSAPICGSVPSLENSSRRRLRSASEFRYGLRSPGEAISRNASACHSPSGIVASLFTKARSESSWILRITPFSVGAP